MRELTDTDSRNQWSLGLRLQNHIVTQISFPTPFLTLGNLELETLRNRLKKKKEIDYPRNKRILREWADNVPRMINGPSKMSKCGKHMTPGNVCFACQMVPDPPPHPSSLLGALAQPWRPSHPWPPLPLSHLIPDLHPQGYGMRWSWGMGWGCLFCTLLGNF